ncbi:Uncharacterised protein [Mycobacteroides abscessus subsp. abscessus]|nr:Uncharacterised protein [Mycobacteroides abscessus subsp. abscessus]
MGPASDYGQQRYPLGSGWPANGLGLSNDQNLWMSLGEAA